MKQTVDIKDQEFGANMRRLLNDELRIRDSGTPEERLEFWRHVGRLAGDAPSHTHPRAYDYVSC